MTDASELLPCPFCNGKNIERGWRHNGAQSYCIDCQAKGPREASENETASSWNTRTDSIAVALIEAERRGMMRAAEIADADAEKLADEAALWAIDKMANAERIALAQHNAGNRISAAIRQAAGELK